MYTQYSNQRLPIIGDKISYTNYLKAILILKKKKKKEKPTLLVYYSYVPYRNSKEKHIHQQL